MDAKTPTGDDFAASIAKKALQKPDENPDETAAALGRELLGVLDKKDPAALGRLFASQVKIAVAEAMKGSRGGR